MSRGHFSKKKTSAKGKHFYAIAIKYSVPKKHRFKEKLITLLTGVFLDTQGHLVQIIHGVISVLHGKMWPRGCLHRWIFWKIIGQWGWEKYEKGEILPKKVEIWTYLRFILWLSHKCWWRGEEEKTNWQH